MANCRYPAADKATRFALGLRDAQTESTRPIMILEHHLLDEAATQRLGTAIAPVLAAGDTLCLNGGLGAGKTALARAIIQARLGQGVEVPSPSYTLINVYDGDPAIWHADLYRLSHGEEVAELGLLDALAGNLVLIEWPGRLGDTLPPRRLEIALEFEGEGRSATLTPIGAGWEKLP
ncbi:MAG: tRNA (adenosine(37)-N6)-threonylcarbamoyltransferase complex ATPase subunit type 1 TsaE [Pseudomonadota bacterium]